MVFIGLLSLILAIFEDALYLQLNMKVPDDGKIAYSPQILSVS